VLCLTDEQWSTVRPVGYGHAEVTRWLSPDMDQVPDSAAMRPLLQQWIAEDARLAAPADRPAIQCNHDDRVIDGDSLTTAIQAPNPPSTGTGSWPVPGSPAARRPRRC
jgi:hypothetical protein